MAIINLSAPWFEHYRQIDSFFKNDSDVMVIFDNEKMTVNVYVNDGVKATALNEILISEKTFGKTTLKIKVIPSNGGTFSTTPIEDYYEAAFRSNDVLSYTKRVTGISSNDFIFVVFKKEIVQYFNDDLGDINGVKTTLYQNIAKNIFKKTENVFYCTDVN